jgi:rhomboid protease GluP
MTPRRVAGVRAHLTTSIVVSSTAAVSIAGLLYPALLHALQRHPTTAGGAWMSWRLLTSLLVHDAWLPLVFNLVGLAIVGVEVERRVGAVRWLFIYLACGIVGELFGVAWQPIGAGDSVAGFGLVGALLILVAKQRAWTPFAAIYALQWIVIFAGLALDGTRGAVIAALVCAPLNPAMARANTHMAGPRLPPRGIAAIALGIALLLCVLHDIHGPPLIAGFLCGAMFTQPWATRPPHSNNREA